MSSSGSAAAGLLSAASASFSQPKSAETKKKEHIDRVKSQMPKHLDDFWEKHLKELDNQASTDKDFKNHNDLPLARIKRIMKSDEDVRMIRAEAPVLFAKACELFILELTMRSFLFSEKIERRNLLKVDVNNAVQNTEIFDFLAAVLAEKEKNAANGASAGAGGK